VTSSFSELALVEPIQRALRAENYTTPTPIQAQAIPHLLAGRDVLGVAQTGTGKTAAFALPILQRLAATRLAPQPKAARALVLTPTRELALQIAESFRTYGRHLALRHAVVLGGVGLNPQIAALARGVDILIATPGRLLDLMNQRHVRFDGLSVLVLDEADRMLDMGFIRDVKRIIAALPKERQTLLFSATMPSDIADLAASVLKSPVRVEVTPSATTVERVDQRVLFVDAARKRSLLAEVLRDPKIARALVFARTKHGANRIAKDLARGNVSVDAIHGNKSQSARQRALEGFRNGRVRVLVATDIAARGIDVDGITHVVNFDLPEVPESYVHRIGRTARAGADGIALSFCSTEERPLLRDIEKLTRRKLSVVESHSFAQAAPRGPAAAPPALPQRQSPRFRPEHPSHRPHRGQRSGTPQRAVSAGSRRPA
jgi:ATP-dependent RNA helicase RhlE